MNLMKGASDEVTAIVTVEVELPVTGEHVREMTSVVQRYNLTAVESEDA